MSLDISDTEYPHAGQVALLSPARDMPLLGVQFGTRVKILDWANRHLGINWQESKAKCAQEYAARIAFANLPVDSRVLASLGEDGRKILFHVSEIHLVLPID